MDEMAPASPRQHRFQGWLVLAVLTAAILATFSLLAWRDLQARHETAARQGHDTTWFIGRNVSEHFRRFDRELTDIVGTIEGAGPAADPNTVWNRMAYTVRTVPHVLSVGLIDADGILVQHTDRRDNPPGMSVADRPHFKDARAALGGHHAIITESMKSRVSGEAIIGLVRPLRAPNGEFGGAVLLAISPDAFDLFAGLPNLPKGSAIAIHRRDGINLFRVPLLPTLGKDLSKTALFTEALPRAAVGVAYTPTDGSALDGADRLLAYRALDDWPLVVVVGILRQEIIAGWRRDWTRNGLLVGVALIGFSWLAIIVQGQITGRLEAELALSRREIEHRLKVEEELRHWATTDALTGLANRRHFIDVAERDMQRAQRYARPMTVLMFDVDHFKLVNDHHGHAVGDDALRLIAKVGLESLRESDLLGRLGGEEFGVLLPETDLAGAVELAERLRAAIAAASFTVSGEQVALSVSIGCCDIAPTDNSIDCVLARADQALYRAKNGGRNRVEVAGAPCQPNRVSA